MLFWVDVGWLSGEDVGVAVACVGTAGGRMEAMPEVENGSVDDAAVTVCVWSPDGVAVSKIAGELVAGALGSCVVLALPVSDWVPGFAGSMSAACAEISLGESLATELLAAGAFKLSVTWPEAGRSNKEADDASVSAAGVVDAAGELEADWPVSVAGEELADGRGA